MGPLHRKPDRNKVQQRDGRWPVKYRAPRWWLGFSARVRLVIAAFSGSSPPAERVGLDDKDLACDINSSSLCITMCLGGCHATADVVANARLKTRRRKSPDAVTAPSPTSSLLLVLLQSCPLSNRLNPPHLTRLLSSRPKIPSSFCFSHCQTKPRPSIPTSIFPALYATTKFEIYANKTPSHPAIRVHDERTRPMNEHCGDLELHLPRSNIEISSWRCHPHAPARKGLDSILTNTRTSVFRDLQIVMH